MQTWDNDQRGLAREFMESRRQGIEKQNAEEEFAQFFTRCDANKDGLLQLDEYLVYVELYRSTKTERGEPLTPMTEEEHVAVHSAINLITPGTDGISMTDILAT